MAPLVTLIGVLEIKTKLEEPNSVKNLCSSVSTSKSGLLI